MPREEADNRGTTFVDICMLLRASAGIMVRNTRIAWERREKGLMAAVTEVKYLVIIVSAAWDVLQVQYMALRCFTLGGARRT
jgi:hypothetical protein